MPRRESNRVKKVGLGGKALNPRVISSFSRASPCGTTSIYIYINLLEYFQFEKNLIFTVSTTEKTGRDTSFLLFPPPQTVEIT